MTIAEAPRDVEAPITLKQPVHASAHASFVGMAALAIGLADASLIVTSMLGARGAFHHVPPRLWVVAPLCWLAVAVAVAAPSYALSRRRGAAWTAIALIAVFFVARFHAQPVTRMTAGAAAAALSMAAVWLVNARWTRSPKRFAVTCVLLLVGAILVSTVVMTRDEASAQAGPTRASADPDVFVVFLDTVSYDAIFPEGAAVDRRFEFLGRLASRSLVFDRAYTPAPWTLPAHFSAVTGLPAHQLGIGFDHQHYDGPGATLAERFHRRGYRTAAVISNSFLNQGTGFARGFETFEQATNALDVCRTAPGTLLDRSWPWFAASVCNWNASEVTRRALDRTAAADSRPLFLLLNYMDAHDPYYVERGCDRPPGANPLPRDVPPDAYRRRYYPSHLAAIRCIDHHLGTLAAEIANRKRPAVIAVLSDHGEQFGEHGLVRHGNSVYARLLHVPFMISGPGVASGRVTAPVSIETLPRLILEIVDRAKAGDPASAVVSSLTPPGALAAGEQWSVIRDRWHFIRRGETRELYDLFTDPGEHKNIVTAPALSSVVHGLEQDLSQARRSRVDVRSVGFRSLGYIR